MTKSPATNWGRFRGLASIIIILATSLLVVGCGTTGKYYRAYPGPSRDQSEVALLTIHREFFGVKAIVRNIDGVPLGQMKFNNTQVAELLPGKHSITVDFTSGNLHSVTSVYLGFDVQAGGSYFLRAAPLTQSFGEALRVGLGGTGEWTAWIVDTKTRKVIAGIPRDEPMRWYEK